MDKKDNELIGKSVNNNVLSMRHHLESKQPKELYGRGVGYRYMRELESIKGLSMSSIEDAIHYEYKATKEVLVTFESKEELFKVLKRIELAELLRVKYCNLENPVIKEFFEHIKKED